MSIPTAEQIAALTGRVGRATGVLPHAAGVAPATIPSRAELRSLPHIRKSNAAHSLHELQADFAFFTHALLFVEGGFRHDPVEEWMLVNDCPGAVFGLEFDRPVFRGHKRPQIGTHYDRLLMGCEREVWDRLYPYLNTITGADPIRKKYVSAFVHKAVMWDPKVWQPGRPVPAEVARLTIHPVGVSTLHGLYHLDSYKGFLPPPYGPDLPKLPRHPNEYLPAVKRGDPEPQTVQMAAALFGGGL